MEKDKTLDPIVGTPEQRSTMSVLTESMEKELEVLEHVMESLATRLSPLLVPSPRKETTQATAQEIAPLCATVSAWRDRIQLIRMAAEKLLEELVI